MFLIDYDFFLIKIIDIDRSLSVAKALCLHENSHFQNFFKCLENIHSSTILLVVNYKTNFSFIELSKDKRHLKKIHLSFLRLMSNKIISNRCILFQHFI